MIFSLSTFDPYRTAASALQHEEDALWEELDRALELWDIYPKRSYDLTLDVWVASRRRKMEHLERAAEGALSILSPI